MESRYQSYSTVVSYQIGASLSIGGNPAQTVNIITFDSDFAINILQGASPTGYAVIVRPTLSSGDTNTALVTATSEAPRILTYNQTSGTVSGLPAYSIATEQWDNGYSIGVGDLVIFEPATNPVWNVTRTVGCADLTSSLYQAENTVRQLHRDIVRTAKRIENITDIDLTNYLLNDYSIESGMTLCSTVAYALDIASGNGRYKGQNFDYAGGALCSFTDKSLCLVEVKTDSSIVSNYENSTGGVLDADYDPSGSSPTPDADTPAWTATGTASTATVSNGVFNLATSSNYRVYDRTGVAGAPATGSTLEAIVQWVSGTGNRLEIDDGTYRCELSIEQSQVKLINDNQTYAIDTAVPFHVVITLKDGNTEVYLNGFSVISSTTQLASISNRFRFGCFASYSGSTPQNTTSNFKIARVKTIGSGARVPSFSSTSGVVTGTVVTVNNSYAPSLGLQNRTVDIDYQYRREGRLITVSDLTGVSEYTEVLKASISASAYSSKTATPYTVLTTDKILDFDATGGAITVNLYTAVGNVGRELTITKIDSSTNAITIDGNGSETIDGLTTILLRERYSSVTIYSNGTNWEIKSSYQCSLTKGAGAFLPHYGCRAWVNFNGTGTVAIRESGNVSSITDNGTGDYTVNYTTSMPDSNYAVVASCIGQTTTTANMIISSSSILSTKTTSSVAVQAKTIGGVSTDVDSISVSIFR